MSQSRPAVAVSPATRTSNCRQSPRVSEDDRTLIDRNQRSYIDGFAGVIHGVLSTVTDPEAHTMAYAALGLMNGHLESAAKVPTPRRDNSSVA